ncbi:hypothetical protein [Streptomyces zingiberis]|uniref:DUF2304 domain-containing protein n=1 Tax=Streptomyces zingiberis TaxID=2053010 RepID=A0ABX1BXG1_9ACTN|nr:hypothetical protein [Streptomyces zingiberis]NJQ02384.1 hypothetical protein [Streptomyces zingiberis]
MGWTVLYIAFGVVALWLLGEVLLQYKARLRWRLLAFAGFSCVVVGVLVYPSRALIGVGTLAFAAGQTLVTLSFRRGFSTGWALGGRPGASKRRKGSPAPDEPPLEFSEVTEGSGDPAHTAAGDGAGDRQGVPGAGEPPEPALYRPEPMPDEDTGGYGRYGDTRYGDPGRGEDAYAATAGAGYGYPGGDQGYADGQNGQGSQNGQGGHDGYAYAGYDDGYGSYAPGPAAAQAAWPGQEQGGYGYSGDGYQQGGGWSEPYPGGQEHGHGQGYAGTGEPYPGTGPYPGGPGPYGSGAAHDPYAGTYDTPPGGVWMPQQREGGGADRTDAPAADQQAYPYQAPPGYSSGGYDEQQYRY